ncbi:MAG TPA: HypC/HybG/HupF family hydrogenase formation chaperone [Myxococcota bacterium]|nr:HypC/HybG/HupF family hydrogenase formation chaperone [Myxococcota bacterium]HQK50588.1 HypC/HybG/HupF family hydrogenase formation chaperone [Myxococcota bacterium]
MCLAVPMRLVRRDGPVGWAEVQGISREVRLDLVPEVRPGEWLIVHAGYAIEVLDEEEARESLEMALRASEDPGTVGGGP